MGRSFPRLLLSLALSTGATATATRLAHADPASAITAEDRARAAAKFHEGEAAFKRHAYSEAADDFEAAYAIAPHPFALWNAADSREKAGDLARAANLCARYLRESPANDANRSEAAARLASLTPRLSRVTITAPGGDGATIDGAPAPSFELFVDPGDHLVAAKFPDGPAERRVSLVAGARASITLEPERARPRPAPFSAMGGERPDVIFAARSQKPLGRGWIVGGAAATAALGGLVLWSGLDTHSAYQAYAKEPTRAGFDDGVSKERRTNVLVVATGVAGAATLTLALFAVEWHPSADPSTTMRIDVVPSGARLGATF
jgi:tetratricopeptide (TPR) repeat protein